MAGTVFHGTYRNGIVLSSVHTKNPVTVAATGYVADDHVAVLGYPGVAWSLTNLGKIEGKGTGFGVILESGGSIINGSKASAAALISAASNTAVTIRQSAGELVNFGTIRGGSATSGQAVFLQHGGHVVNGQIGSGHALISGKGSGIILSSAAPGGVTNFGRIESTTTVLVGGSLHAVAVLLGDGGALLNGAAGATQARVTAAELGVYIGGIGGAPTPGAAPATVTNFGTIASTGLGAIGSNALRIVSGGSVVNHGLIESAASSAVSFHDKAGTVTNFGKIVTTSAGSGDGIYLQNGGRVINKAGGRISGNAKDGIIIHGARGIVVNYGAITSVGDRGVYIGAGGTVTNRGVIETQAASHPGVSFHQQAGTVTNFGSIESHGNQGIYFQIGGRVTNQKDGLIQGGTHGNGIEIKGGAADVTNSGRIAGPRGIYVNSADSAAVTLTNAGAITGTGGTAVQFGAGNDLLVVDPGATFGGVADGRTGRNTLELAAGSRAGSLKGLGTRFVAFGTVKFNAGSAWTLAIDKPADFGETVLGFAKADTIDLAGIKATSVSLAKGVLTVSHGAAAVARFAMPTEAPTTVFHLASDGHGGTDLAVAAAAGPASLTTPGATPFGGADGRSLGGLSDTSNNLSAAQLLSMS